MNRTEKEQGLRIELINRRLRRISARVRSVEDSLQGLNQQDKSDANPRVIFNAESVYVENIQQLNVLSPGSIQIGRESRSGGQQPTLEQSDTEVIAPTDPRQADIVDGPANPGQRPGRIRRTIASLTSRIPRPTRRNLGRLAAGLIIVGASVGAVRTLEHFWPQPGRVEPATKTPSASSATPRPSEAGASPAPTLAPTDEIGAKSPILSTPTPTPTSTPKLESTATPRPTATAEPKPSSTPRPDKQPDSKIALTSGGATLKEGAIVVVKTVNHENRTITIEALKLPKERTLAGKDDRWLEENGSYGYSDINAAALAACGVLQGMAESFQPNGYLPPDPRSGYKRVLHIQKGYTVGLPPDCKPE